MFPRVSPKLHALITTVVVRDIIAWTGFTCVRHAEYKWCSGEQLTRIIQMFNVDIPQQITSDLYTVRIVLFIDNQCLSSSRLYYNPVASCLSCIHAILPLLIQIKTIFSTLERDMTIFDTLENKMTYCASLSILMTMIPELMREYADPVMAAIIGHWDRVTGPTSGI